MAIEIEKKYRLTEKQREEVLSRLPEIGAKRKGKVLEVNTLFAGGTLEEGSSVLRLRRAGGRATLTYKKRLPGRSAVKEQREDETPVADPDALEAILEALGFTASLLYEKRRETWTLGKSEIVIDELPFGLFMEIEGAEKDILMVESKLGIKGLRAETATYPQLTRKHGKDRGGVIESRFLKEQ